MKFCFKWGFVVGVWIILLLSGLFFYYSIDLPDINPVVNDKSEVNIEVMYNNGAEIKKYGNLNTDITNYAEFPLYLIDGLTATEDRKFFKHHGFDYFGIVRAAFVNLSSGYIKQGGSTITQQLSKMILKNNEKTFKRKIQELMLSVQLERKLTKEQILMMYLNKAYFGAGQYGISGAAKFYFNKRVSNLDLEECAMLIGLLKAPSKYSPQNNPILSKERTKQIIMNMYNAKLLSDVEYRKYLNTYFASVIDATINSDERLNEELYFSEWVKSQLPDYTKKTNIKVKTTLDLKIQNAIEQSIEDFRFTQNEKLKNSQIAVVALGKDGAVLGMTGGVNFNRSEFNRAIYAYRQAGSAFKIFVYLAGIREKHFNTSTRFVDEPVAVGNWFPENYNEKYYGEVSMKEGFAKSLNSVAIQINEYAGIKNVAKMAKKMGILSEIDQNDPTIALGTTQINLLELTSAYAVILNNGNAIIPYSITEIKDKDTNNIIYVRKASVLSKILTENEVDQMQEMMYAVINTGTAQNAKIEDLMYKGYGYIGGKTGTSQNYSDAWFIGYANDITLGIWIGNDDNTSMGKIAGGTLPAILWKKIVEKIYY
ncbi:MAG TPA: PBP1A family penicillin-binding protein [Rickettsiales bacterium]|nr:PBP1A family penicillin-binding protein [Rickettsiales bacterium]